MPAPVSRCSDSATGSAAIAAGTLSAYLPAGDAVGVFAVLDEHARQAGVPGDERTLAARRGDALADLMLNPIGFCSAGTSAARDHTTEPGGGHQSGNDTAKAIELVGRSGKTSAGIR